MRRDTTAGGGERYAQPSWPAIQCVLSAIGLLQCAITSHQYGRAVASGSAHFNPCATIAMPLRVGKSATMRGGRGLKNHSAHLVYPCLRRVYDFTTQN